LVVAAEAVAADLVRTLPHLAQGQQERAAAVVVAAVAITMLAVGLLAKPDLHQQAPAHMMGLPDLLGVALPEALEALAARVLATTGVPVAMVAIGAKMAMPE